MCVCASVHGCMYIWSRYACVSVGVCVCKYGCVCVCVCKYGCMGVCACVHVCVCVLNKMSERYAGMYVIYVTLNLYI